MNIPNSLYHRHRFPSEVIAYAVFAYHRFALSLRDAEDLLAERGVTVNHETMRVWCAHYGPTFARQLRKHQPGVEIIGISTNCTSSRFGMSVECYGVLSTKTVTRSISSSKNAKIDKRRCVSLGNHSKVKAAVQND